MTVNSNAMLPLAPQNNQPVKQHLQVQAGQIKPLQTTQAAVSKDMPKLQAQPKSDVVMVNKKEADKKTAIAAGIGLLAAVVTGIAAFRFGKTKAVPVVEQVTNTEVVQKAAETTQELLEKTVADAKEFQTKAQTAAEKTKEYTAKVEEKMTSLRDEVISLFDKINDNGEIVVDGKTVAKIEDSSERYCGRAVKTLKEFNDDGTTLKRQSTFVHSFVDDAYKPQSIEEFIDATRNKGVFDISSGNISEYFEGIHYMADDKIVADKYTEFFGTKGSICYENCEILSDKHSEDGLDHILKYSNMIDLNKDGKMNAYVENYNNGTAKKTIGFYDISEQIYDNAGNPMYSETDEPILRHVPRMRYAEDYTDGTYGLLEGYGDIQTVFDEKENIASKILEFEDGKPVVFVKQDILGASDNEKSGVIWKVLQEGAA